jgi:uncharacterized linocin/CFP29 family protein
VTDHLRRDLAPIGPAAWAAIEDEAAKSLRHFLSARPLVDFGEPRGWAHAAVSLGRTEDVGSGPAERVEAAVRRVQPVVELRAPFTLSLAELDTVDRGAEDADLGAVVEAARRAATAEDTTIFYGFEPGSVTGMVEATPHTSLTIPGDYNQYPGVVARAVALLRASGVGGPYGIALGPRCYTGVIETTEHGGYPVLEHLRTILGGPIVWAPAIDGAVVVSLRGGDYRFEPGQDWSIGYRGHHGDAIELYLEESFTFRVVDDRAAVALRYPS